MPLTLDRTSAIGDHLSYHWPAHSQTVGRFPQFLHGGFACIGLPPPVSSRPRSTPRPTAHRPTDHHLHGPLHRTSTNRLSCVVLFPAASPSPRRGGHAPQDLLHKHCYADAHQTFCNDQPEGPPALQGLRSVNHLRVTSCRAELRGLTEPKSWNAPPNAHRAPEGTLRRTSAVELLQTYSAEEKEEEPEGHLQSGRPDGTDAPPHPRSCPASDVWRVVHAGVKYD